MTIDRRAFLDAVAARRDSIVEATRRLIAAPSPNPPLDCRAAAEVARALIGEAVPEVAVEAIEMGDSIVNLLAVLKGRAPGRRVVLSGHLDTYPVLEELPWTVDPLGGEVREGRIYGRGACDMKGGIAASIAAFAVLAEHRAHWSGEVVLALSGDEESMGERGAKWLIENRPEMQADAVLIADVGSPEVLRFGEKGFLWIELEAQGKPAHGAHVHLGENAIERLMAGLQAMTGLRKLAFEAPAAITAAIARAAPVSERLAGKGESDTLNALTVNIGRIEGGISPNLIPATARAGGDIRLPVGVTCAEAEAFLHAALDPLPGISWRITRRIEPRFTDPEHELVRTAVAAATEVRGAAPAVNMRVGGSDARLFRAAGLPTIVYGPTPFGMGGADESVLIEELVQVAAVQALTTLDLLQG